jgi:hypothetical protein
MSREKKFKEWAEKQMPDNYDQSAHSIIEIDQFMKSEMEMFQDTVIKTIDYLRHNPEAIESFNGSHPFNSPLLKDVDFANVKTAYFEGDTLKIEYYGE